MQLRTTMKVSRRFQRQRVERRFQRPPGCLELRSKYFGLKQEHNLLFKVSYI